MVVVVVGRTGVVVVVGGGTCVVVVTAVVTAGAVVVVVVAVGVVVTVVDVGVETGVDDPELGALVAVLRRVWASDAVTTTTFGVPLGDRIGSADGLVVNSAAKSAPATAPTATLPGSPKPTGPDYLDHPIGSSRACQ